MERFPVDGDDAAGGFGRFDKVFGQLFQLGRLAFQDFDVFTGLWVFQILPVKKIGVVDDGGQRGF